MTIPLPTIVPFEKNILPDILMLYANTNMGLAAWSLELEQKLMYGSTKPYTMEEAYAQVARECHISIDKVSLIDGAFKLNITLYYDKKE